MNPLSLSVVGHTNTGKTSLLRTLLRDVDFGDVQDEAGTTRHVEKATIHDGDVPLLHLYDTPGLEDASAVLDWLEAHTSDKKDGIERIQQFLTADIANSTLNQEAKVLRQLLTSDAALYVIDAQEAVLARYKDELTILSWCAKPIMPVFNFLANQDYSEWQTMLARRALHVYSGFDTVAFDFQSEIKLWQNLCTMLPEKAILQRLIETRQREWQQIQNQSANDIAQFLIDIAAYRQIAPEESDSLWTQMQAQVRQREHTLQQTLMHHYRFYQNQIITEEQQIAILTQDPFDSELWKAYGIRTGKGAAVGALLGLGVDVLALGSSLGLGTAIGSMLGGMLPNMHTLSDTFNGKHRLQIDDAGITLLAARALTLWRILQQRGHAAQTPITLAEKNLPWQVDRLPEILRKARHQEPWSALNETSGSLISSAPREVVLALAHQLMDMV